MARVLTMQYRIETSPEIGHQIMPEILRTMPLPVPMFRAELVAQGILPPLESKDYGKHIVECRAKEVVPFDRAIWEFNPKTNGFVLMKRDNDVAEPNFNEDNPLFQREFFKSLLGHNQTHLQIFIGEQSEAFAHFKQMLKPSGLLTRDYSVGRSRLLLDQPQTAYALGVSHVWSTRLVSDYITTGGFLILMNLGGNLSESHTGTLDSWYRGVMDKYYLKVHTAQSPSPEYYLVYPY